MKGRWIALLALAAVVLLLLPMPIAERYTSPTQDGQYLSNPANAYRFVLAAALVNTSSELNTSGEALDRAKELFKTRPYRPTKVELLFLPGRSTYAYTTKTGVTLTVEKPDDFVWEVWGTQDDPAEEDTTALKGGEIGVIGFLDYVTGELLEERP